MTKTYRSSAAISLLDYIFTTKIVLSHRSGPWKRPRFIVDHFKLAYICWNKWSELSSLLNTSGELRW